jgi:hypothetical protein
VISIVRKARFGDIAKWLRSLDPGTAPGVHLLAANVRIRAEPPPRPGRRQLAK